MKRFRGGRVFKAHRPLYHSTLGLRVVKKKKKGPAFAPPAIRFEFRSLVSGSGFRICGLGSRVSDVQFRMFETLIWGRECRVQGLETVASATLGRSQDVCKGSRSRVEGELCVVSS